MPQQTNEARSALAKELLIQLGMLSDDAISELEDQLDGLPEVDPNSGNDCLIDYELRLILSAYRTLWLATLNLEGFLGMGNDSELEINSDVQVQ